MRILAFCLAMLLPLATHAAETARKATFFVGEEVCNWAIEHMPEDDVAYTPGVDVAGNPVVPASPDQQRVARITDHMLREVNIELTSDIARQLGIPPNLIRQRLNVGTIEVDDQNRLTVNGELLVEPDAAAWHEACELAKQHN